MDPDENYREQVRIAKAIIRTLDTSGYEGISGGRPPSYADMDDVARLAELVVALDEWAKRGGFPPSRFRKNRGARIF